MAEKEKKGRRFSADEKLAIIDEARAPNTTVAEVLRRHQVDGATFYQWEKRAKASMLEALGKSAGGKPGGDGTNAADRAKDQRIARLEADLERKKGIIAEVVEENLLLKRGL